VKKFCTGKFWAMKFFSGKISRTHKTYHEGDRGFFMVFLSNETGKFSRSNISGPDFFWL